MVVKNTLQMSVKGKNRTVHLGSQVDSNTWSAKVNVGSKTIYGQVKINAVGARRFYPSTGLNAELL